MNRPENYDNVRKKLPMILATSIFMQMLDSTILNTSLPAIAKDLHESPLEMQNAIVSYVLTLAIVMPLSGTLSDRFGTQKVFIVSLVLFVLGSLFCALSQNLTQLIFSRILQGLGGSVMTPVGRLALIKTFDKKDIVKALNFVIIPALIGPILGPLVGGYMVDYFSWHWIFLINIPIGLLGVILSIKYMPNYQTDENYFDYKGFSIFVAASLLLSISLELFSYKVTPLIILSVFLFGILMFYFYYLYARRSENPIFSLNLFQVRTFRVGIVGNIATRLGISSIPLLLPLMIQLSYGQSAITSGWLVTPMALTGMFGKSAVIKILNLLGYKRILLINTVIIGVLICILAIPGVHTSIFWYVPILLIMGFFNSIQFTAMNTISIADLSGFQESSGNSLISVNQQLAIAFGISFGLMVLNVFQSIFGKNHETLQVSFKFTFILLGVLTMISSSVFRRLHYTDGNNMRQKH